MKLVLLVLIIIQVIGVISSAYLGGSLTAGIQDSKEGIMILAGLWLVYFLYTSYKNKRAKNV